PSGRAPLATDVPAAALEEARKLAVERSRCDVARTEFEAQRAALHSGSTDHDVAPSPSTGLTLLLLGATALAGAVVAVLHAPLAWVVVALTLLVLALQLRARFAPAPDGGLDAHAVLRRDIDSRLARVSEREAQVAARAAELLAAHGIEAGTGDGAIAEVLGRMALARETVQDAQAARAGTETIAAAAADVLARIVELSAPLDQAPPRDAAGARSLCDALDAACREAAAATERVQVAEASVTDLEATVAEALADLDTFRAARGIDAGTLDDIALTRLTELWALRPTWVARTEARTAQRAIEADALTRVAPGSRDELLARAVEELEAEHLDCRDAAARHDDVLQEVNSLEGSVAAANAATTVGDALLALDAAADELAARRDEALRLAAASFLLEEAAGAYERTAAPRILTDANDFLARATAGRYELAIDEAGTIAARDRRALHAPTRSLAALSGGTRAQLLIATRLAFARSAELGEPLPVFIDEALTTTDPERFEAVFEALAAIAAADGRQFLYLTSNAADAGLVDAVLTRAGHAPARHLQVGPRSVAPIRELPPRREVPTPTAGEPSEAWATRLGVPPLDLHADPESIHVWHLLEADASLVHRLLQARVTRVGEVRNLAGRGLLDAIVGAEGAHAIRTSLDAWDAFVPEWRKGRTRPFTHRDDVRDVLVLADIKADTWLDRVWDAAVQLDHDPAALVTGIRSGSVKVTGFGSKVDDLEHALRRSGHLPEGDLLDDVVVEAAVRSVLPADAPHHASDLARRWIQRAGNPEGAPHDS
ncbi:MAG: hypothetical protein JWO69_582, partial [Thermoleophilia bacterium]|nr:hypothetical protein [Thermoleophilia bacterium]